MALSRSDETDILASLHAGPLDPSPWQTFLERLRKRLGAEQVALVIRAPGANLQDWFAGHAPRSGAQARVVELFGPADPLGLRHLRVERIYALGDIVDPGDPVQVGIVRDLLMPAGENHLRMLRVTEPGGAMAWLRVSRAGGDFSAAVASILSSLAPHLAIALRSFVWAAQVRRRAALCERVERLAGLGWITFDPAGPVLDLSAGAREMLGQVPGLRPVAGERLGLPDAASARALVQGLEAAAAGQGSALMLGLRPRIELRLLPHEGREPGLTGLLRLENRPEPEAMVTPLIGLYGLSRSEARLAAHLAAGASLAEAAKALSLTVETARTYSKRLFDKTGARGQPDLVRHVLTGAAALG